MNSLASLISLGCAKNLVDSEIMVAQLLRSGYCMTEDPAKASVVVVNTCGFLLSAVEEGVQCILEMVECKSSGSCKCLIMTGCMVQRYGKKLAALLPEVDLFLGTSHCHRLAEILFERQAGNERRVWLAAPRHLLDADTPRTRSTPPHTAYLKIAEGCGNSCSFCLIPHLRGPYRSRTIPDLVREAEMMVSEGVKEINLIAQDTAAFGMDREGSPQLIPLLESMERLPGLLWVRLLYSYPDRVTDDLLDWIAQSEKIVPYLDIPIQHSSMKLLEKMRTNGSRVDPRDLVGRVRSKIPSLSLRTSLMVGFPGETEADFQDLLEFLQEAQFDHLGVFAFSPEPGTAAARYHGQLDDTIKEERKRILLEHQQEISRRRLERLVGQVLPVLVEGYHPETNLLLCGRLATQAPEVDGGVLITRGLGIPGEFARARITTAHSYDLEAELLPL